MRDTTDYATHGTPDERLELRHLIAQTVRMNDPRLDPPAYGVVRDVRDAELVEVEWTSGSWAGQVTAWAACELVPLGIGARPDDDEREGIDLETLTYIDDNGDERTVRSHLDRDRGDAPASRYGRTYGQWSEVVLAAVASMQAATGEPETAEGIDALTSLVVNDSPDVARLIADYGHELGLDPFDYIDAIPCERCGGDLDRDCYGEDRCEACDGPCPGCHDGPGPDVREVLTDGPYCPACETAPCGEVAR